MSQRIQRHKTVQVANLKPYLNHPLTVRVVSVGRATEDLRAKGEFILRPKIH